MKKLLILISFIGLALNSNAQVDSSQVSPEIPDSSICVTISPENCINIDEQERFPKFGYDKNGDKYLILTMGQDKALAFDVSDGELVDSLLLKYENDQKISDREIAARDSTIDDLNTIILDKDKQLLFKDTLITNQDTIITKQKSFIGDQQGEIKRLKTTKGFLYGGLGIFAIILLLLHN